jgi:hypothetical protein
MEGQPEAEEQADEVETASGNGRPKKKAVDRTRFRRQADRLAREYESDFGEAAGEALDQDRKQVEAIINGLNREALDARASLNWLAVIEEISGYLAGPSLANWQRHFVLPLHMLMTDRINDLSQEFGKGKISLGLYKFASKQDSPSSAEMLAREWFDEYTIQFAQPINATTEEQIRRLVEQGISEGWSVPTMQKRLKLVFEQWMSGDLAPEIFDWFAERMPEWRREMIARTETIKAMNTVSYRLYGDWGVEEHEWLSANDDRTRREPYGGHLAADGQVRRVGMPFDVGGEKLLYPGDPRGSPGNIINCRCVTIPIV